MTRPIQRLTSLVCLVVYVFTSTNVCSALPSIKRAFLSDSTFQSQTDHPSPTASRKCRHCRHKTEPEKRASSNRPEAGRNERTNESDCPCCPSDSSSKSNPCPGCVICHAAKAPTLAASGVEWAFDQVVAECCLDEFAWIPSTFHDGLVRPPRA